MDLSSVRLAPPRPWELLLLIILLIAIIAYVTKESPRWFAESAANGYSGLAAYFADIAFRSYGL